jgi:hypothetical protein
MRVHVRVTIKLVIDIATNIYKTGHARQGLALRGMEKIRSVHGSY